MRRRPWFKHIIIAIAGSGLLFLATIAFLIAQGPWLPYLFADGPFTGEPAAVPHGRAPDQKFPVRSYILEVFNSTDGVTSPVVALRDPNGNIKWSVKAHGWETNDVEKLHFVDHRTIFDATIRGSVKWTYGNEGAWWIIGRNGDLKAYYYSW